MQVTRLSHSSWSHYRAPTCPILPYRHLDAALWFGFVVAFLPLRIFTMCYSVIVFFCPRAGCIHLCGGWNNSWATFVFTKCLWAPGMKVMDTSYREDSILPLPSWHRWMNYVSWCKYTYIHAGIFIELVTVLLSYQAIVIFPFQLTWCSTAVPRIYFHNHFVFLSSNCPFN